jgi:hypothetical protein
MALEAERGGSLFLLVHAAPPIERRADELDNLYELATDKDAARR